MGKVNITKPYEPEILKRLHKVHVEMLKDFQKVCKKHNLRYFAVYGTAIGTVRHQGFIPWDDDIDVGMLREDFEKFMQIAEKELGDHYRVMSPAKTKQSAGSVVKLQRKGTLFISNLTKDFEYEQCIFLDIFPFDFVAPTEKLRQRQLFKTTYLDRLIYLCGTAYPLIPLKGILGKAASGICWMVHYALKIFHISPRFLYRCFEKESARYNGQKGEMVTCFGQPSALKEMFRYQDMFPLEEVPFEEGTIHILHNNDEALRKVYGDYMQIPPADKQVNHCPYILQFEGEEPIINR